MLTPYFAHGVTLALAWFLIVNAIVSFATAVAASRLSEGERRPGFWFLLRVLPSITSAIFVAALFLPSYWRYEPAETKEGFDITLTAFAAGAIVLVAFAAARGAVAWLRAHIRARKWLRNARSCGEYSGLPAFTVDTAVPLMALVGILRPRLVISAPLVDALSIDEMQASIAHELAHRSALDNLKRLSIRLSPDLLAGSSAARAIERRWAAASEQRADSLAGGGDPTMRCALASALVKVARMMPASALPQSLEPISALVDGGDITARVERLLDDRACQSFVPQRRTRRTAFALVIIAAISIGYSASLVTVHEATETLVQRLP